MDANAYLTAVTHRNRTASAAAAAERSRLAAERRKGGKAARLPGDKTAPEGEGVNSGATGRLRRTLAKLLILARAGAASGGSARGEAARGGSGRLGAGQAASRGSR